MNIRTIGMILFGLATILQTISELVEELKKE
ncbi:hypothetical protein LA10_03553 [Thermotoga neapolitana LA10]|nr:hypothetical protein LA10_03553 [Thermotoga neapolitana LA10]